MGGGERIFGILFMFVFDSNLAAFWHIHDVNLFKNVHIFLSEKKKILKSLI